jgi:predicted nucleic acid-binding protein
VIVFDSSFVIAFHNERDAHHEAARALMERFLEGEWGRGLLLEYVVLEVATVLLMRRNLAVAAAVARLLLAAAELDFVPCADLFADALEGFAGQQGTRLSFVDAAIAHVALERAGGLVLTFDEEFRKIAGLRVPGAARA